MNRIFASTSFWALPESSAENLFKSLGLRLRFTPEVNSGCSAVAHSRLKAGCVMIPAFGAEEA